MEASTPPVPAVTASTPAPSLDVSNPRVLAVVASNPPKPSVVDSNPTVLARQYSTPVSGPSPVLKNPSALSSDSLVGLSAALMESGDLVDSAVKSTNAVVDSTQAAVQPSRSIPYSHNTPVSGFTTSSEQPSVHHATTSSRSASTVQPMQSAPVVQPFNPTTLPVASAAVHTPAQPVGQPTAVQFSAEHAVQPVNADCSAGATGPDMARAEVPSGLVALQTATTQPVQPEALHISQLMQPDCAMRPGVPLTATASLPPAQSPDVPSDTPANLLRSEPQHNVVEDIAKAASSDGSPQRRRQGCCDLLAMICMCSAVSEMHAAQKTAVSKRRLGTACCFVFDPVEWSANLLLYAMLSQSLPSQSLPFNTIVFSCALLTSMYAT